MAGPALVIERSSSLALKLPPQKPESHKARPKEPHCSGQGNALVLEDTTPYRYVCTPHIDGNPFRVIVDRNIVDVQIKPIRAAAPLSWQGTVWVL